MRTPEGRKYGPISRQEMDAWFGEGRIDIDCQIFCEGWEQWKWAAEVYPQPDIAHSVVAATAETANPSSIFPLSIPDLAVSVSDTPVSAPQPTFSIAPSAMPRDSMAPELPAIALRTADRSWVAVDIGLAVANVSLWAVFACLLCLIIAWAGASDADSLPPPLGRSANTTASSPLLLLSVWGTISLCGASVALLAGWSSCLRVSKRSSAHSLILAAVACLAAAMSVALLLSTIPLGVSHVLAPAERLAALAWAGLVLVCLLFATALSLFGLFLGRLGALFGDWGLNQQGTFFVASQVATAIWSGAGSFLFDGDSTGVELLRIVVTALLLLGNCYWLGSLVRRARRSLKTTQPAFEPPGTDEVQ